MSGTTRLYVFDDKTSAQNAAALYKGAGKNVVLVGPSDVIRSEGKSPSKIEWDSGPGVDWYMVVVTNDPVAVGGEILNLP